MRDVCYNRSLIERNCAASIRLSTLMYLRFPPMMYLQQQKLKCLSREQKKREREREVEREREREEEELPDDLMN